MATITECTLGLTVSPLRQLMSSSATNVMAAAIAFPFKPVHVLILSQQATALVPHTTATLLGVTEKLIVVIPHLSMTDLLQSYHQATVFVTLTSTKPLLTKLTNKLSTSLTPIPSLMVQVLPDGSKPNSNPPFTRMLKLRPRKVQLELSKS